MQRAHALVQIKKADDETRTLRGLASTPSTDRQGDILLPMGAQFKLPFPLLWQHDHAQPVGQVTDARATATGIVIVARFAAEGVSDRIDECWRLVKAGLVRGLSVGFVPIEREVIQTGWKFPVWEIIELSCVTVPANAEAEILEVKRLDASHAKAAEPVEAGAYPDWPGHLAPSERQAVLESTARRMVNNLLTETAKQMGKTEYDIRKKFGAAYMAEQETKAVSMIVSHWHGQRLKALEAKIAKMEGNHA